MSGKIVNKKYFHKLTIAQANSALRAIDKSLKRDGFEPNNERISDVNGDGKATHEDEVVIVESKHLKKASNTPSANTHRDEFAMALKTAHSKKSMSVQKFNNMMIEEGSDFRIIDSDGDGRVSYQDEVGQVDNYIKRADETTSEVEETLNRVCRQRLKHGIKMRFSTDARALIKVRGYSIDKFEFKKGVVNDALRMKQDQYVIGSSDYDSTIDGCNYTSTVTVKADLAKGAFILINKGTTGEAITIIESSGQKTYIFN